MSKLLSAIALTLSLTTAGAAELTPLETRWLQAAAPVLAYAKRLNLPLDIIVQPQARSSDVAMAMGFDKGRCKLVMSMRGNPEAEKPLDGIAPEQQALFIETMAAHEIGHCWRYVQGSWHALPAGFVETGHESAEDPELLAQSKAMRENRREEGFADLAALAWVQRFHADDYGRVYAWLHELRNRPPDTRAAHDTRAGVRLARDAGVFAAGATPFEAAGATWSQGLLSDDQGNQ
jgi:hypothetical protein